MKSSLCVVVWACLAASLAGCTALQAPKVESPSLYQLETRPAMTVKWTARESILTVGTPAARPGFDTPQMAYVRQAHKIEYFVKNRWIDTPSRMLAPLLAQALEQAGGFRAVLHPDSQAPADLRLDTELIRLQQDFSTHPSRMELTLRAQLYDLKGRRVLATRVFDITENAASEDAYGGVIAANRALERLLEQVSEFCFTESGVR